MGSAASTQKAATGDAFSDDTKKSTRRLQNPRTTTTPVKKVMPSEPNDKAHPQRPPGKTLGRAKPVKRSPSGAAPGYFLCPPKKDEPASQVKRTHR